MKSISLTNSQYKAIQNYRERGFEIKYIKPDKIKITQQNLLNGYLLNQKQLVKKAKDIFPDKKIIPVVYSLDTSNITIEWIKSKMLEFGIKNKDLIKQLAIDKLSLNLYLSGKKKINRTQLAAFYFYFLTYELNRNLREHLNQ